MCIGESSVCMLGENHACVRARKNLLGNACVYGFIFETTMIKRKDGAYIDYDTLLKILQDCRETLADIAFKDTTLKAMRQKALHTYNNTDVFKN